MKIVADRDRRGNGIYGGQVQMTEGRRRGLFLDSKNLEVSERRRIKH
jgi:hypothetical protein